MVLRKYPIRTLKLPVEVETTRYRWYNGLQRKGVNLMDCKIVITCDICKCKAEISPLTWKESGVYTCPNCRERMPVDYWATIKNAIGALSIVPDSYDGFSVSIAKSGISLDNHKDES